MIIIDGYAIQENPKRNEIIISLPQTLKTCTNTVGAIEDRKESLSEIEQTIILTIVKNIYQGLYG